MFKRIFFIKMSAITTRKINSELRYHALQERYHVLYNEKRLRLDDVLESLSLEFYLGYESVRKILRKRLIPKETLLEQLKKNKATYTGCR